MPKEKFASEYPFYDIPGPIAVAHRGGDAARIEKENSLAAFESAHRAGIIYAETDTVATKDGVALAFHGARNKSQEEKTGLPLRSLVQSMTHSEVMEKVRVGGERLPLIEELLTTFPDMRFFIDPKTPESVEPTARIIKSLHAEDRVSIGAFHYKRTKETAELLGGQKDICTSLAAIGSIAMLGLRSRLTSDLARPYFNRTRATSLQVPHGIVTPSMIERAHDLGIHVIVWTPNTKEAIAGALDKGVHGVMSDRTELMKREILSRDPSNRSIRLS